MRISDWSSDVCSSDLEATMIPRRKLLNFTRDFMFSRPLSVPANWMAKRDLIGHRKNASGRNLLPADPPRTEQRGSRATHRAPRTVAPPMDPGHAPRNPREHDHPPGTRTTKTNK